MKRNEILTEIFYGHYDFDEIQLGDEYFLALSKEIEKRKELDSKLIDYPEIKSLLSEVENLSANVNLETCEVYYTEAFRIGLLTGLDIAGLFGKEK